jgi:hypothetical protein
MFGRFVVNQSTQRHPKTLRAIHLAAGFPHELWPRSVEDFCIAKSFTSLASIHQNETDESKRNKQGWNSYEAANNGEPFDTFLGAPYEAF